MTTATAASDSYEISHDMKVRVLKALDGMRTIAKAEMMQRVGYLSDQVVNPRRVRSVCGGHQACAVGSLWLAAGIKPRGGPDYVELPGANQGIRETFIANKPVLRHALHFLNQAADEYMRANRIRGNPTFWLDSIEALFESSSRKLEGDNRRLAMLSVISAAKRKVRAA